MKPPASLAVLPSVFVTITSYVPAVLKKRLKLQVIFVEDETDTLLPLIVVGPTSFTVAPDLNPVPAIVALTDVHENRDPEVGDILVTVMDPGVGVGVGVGVGDTLPLVATIQSHIGWYIAVIAFDTESLSASAIRTSR